MNLEITRTGLEQQFFELFAQVAQEQHLYAYDLTYHPNNFSLCLYVMNKATKTALIEDCVRIDEALTPYFESSDWVPEGLMLEVSSPGIYREIRSYEQLEMSLGERLAILLEKPLSECLVDEKESASLPKRWQKEKKITAVLDKINREYATFKLEDLKLEVSLALIKKANLDPELKKSKK